MNKLLALLTLFSALASVLLGCGTTPEPTIPPPTQTPWIIVVTATPGPERVAESQPTQTPWIIVATPTRASRATPTATKQAAATTGSTTEPTPTPARVQPTPTDTPEPESLIYPAPVLLEPPDGVTVPWKATVLLKWTSVGKLAEDEYYHLHLDRPPQTAGQEWYGDYVFTKETSYLLEGAFLAPFHPSAEQGQATVYWSVRVVRKTGEDENGKPVGVDISQPSEKRNFIVDPKPSES
jgi:hypothetical protein